MAVRSDCSASSGRTSSAGGVRRPARCSAASTSTISERRESSEPRICCSRRVERAQPRFGVADAGLDAAHLGCDIDQLLIELAAVLADRGDIGLQLGLQFGGALLLRAGGLELLLALLDGVGRGAVVCGAARRLRCRRLRGEQPAIRQAGQTSRSGSGSARDSADDWRCQGRIECLALSASGPISVFPFHVHQRAHAR